MVKPAVYESGERLQTHIPRLLSCLAQVNRIKILEKCAFAGTWHPQNRARPAGEFRGADLSFRTFPGEKTHHTVTVLERPGLAPPGRDIQVVPAGVAQDQQAARTDDRRELNIVQQLLGW